MQYALTVNKYFYFIRSNTEKMRSFDYFKAFIQIRAFRLADNKVSEAAQWDMDLLPLELADIVMPMADFGFEVISDDDFSENFTLDDGEKKPFQQISITVHDEQAKLILAAIKYVYDQKAVTETFTNENHNGNGLYEVVRQWAVQKKLL